MLRADLAAAGIACQEASGRYADFRSLLHTFISDLARAGVHPKNAQVFARHSKITLTMDHCTHTVLGDLARDVAELPRLDLQTNEAVALAGTGTDGAPDEPSKRRIKRRLKSDSEGRNGANRGNDRQDRPTSPGDGAPKPKSLRLADKDTACQRVASHAAVRLCSLQASGADEIRTRNHRIDSPVPTLVRQALAPRYALQYAQNRTKTAQIRLTGWS
ncbi:hypothetical protein LCGC14_2174260 [marine sediment metagenome]|uniref:Uncharacterized protein n=1 Tax=marine sediment metagenome TaxID=412755 RepID=A0A0F9EBC9_9ZZZZ